MIFPVRQDIGFIRPTISRYYYRLFVKGRQYTRYIIMVHGSMDDFHFQLFNSFFILLPFSGPERRKASLPIVSPCVPPDFRAVGILDF